MELFRNIFKLVLSSKIWSFQSIEKRQKRFLNHFDHFVELKHFFGIEHRSPWFGSFQRIPLWTPNYPGNWFLSLARKLVRSQSLIAFVWKSIPDASMWLLVANLWYEFKGGIACTIQITIVPTATKGKMSLGEN